MVYVNLMLLQKHSPNSILYPLSPGWCSPLLMSQAKAKVVFEKSVTMLNMSLQALADQ